MPSPRDSGFLVTVTQHSAFGYVLGYHAGRPPGLAIRNANRFGGFLLPPCPPTAADKGGAPVDLFALCQFTGNFLADN